MLLLWCVCGGFLQHFYDSSFLDILLKRNYEDPVDTAQDVIDRVLGVISTPGSESIVEMLKNSPSEVTRTLAERTIVAKVIFCSTDSILTLYFHERIGLNMMGGQKMRFVAALLLLKMGSFILNTWIWGNGTEVKRRKVVTTHLLPTC